MYVRVYKCVLRVCVHTSKLCGAGEVFFKSSAEFRIILKVIKVMFHPLTEYIQNPNDTHRHQTDMLTVVT